MIADQVLQETEWDRDWKEKERWRSHAKDFAVVIRV